MAPNLLDGKVAAITGGLTGIGRAIAIQFVKEGAKVAINCLEGPSDEDMKPFRDALGEDMARMIVVPGDVSKPETGEHLVQETLHAFTRLDIFVTNAGICQFADFLAFVDLLVSSSLMAALLTLMQHHAVTLLQNGSDEFGWRLLRYTSCSPPDV